MNPSSAVLVYSSIILKKKIFNVKQHKVFFYVNVIKLFREIMHFRENDLSEKMLNFAKILFAKTISVVAAKIISAKKLVEFSGLRAQH